MATAVPSPASPALFEHFPALERAMPWASLGVFPTPVEPLRPPPWMPRAAPMFVKREDLSSPHYGGNKVRTLEAHLGLAAAEGARRVWAVGAYGSNQALAAAIHAPRAGLAAGLMLFPQPPTEPARDNLLAALAQEPARWPLTTVAALPFAMARAPRAASEPIYVMPPGGANPTGVLAHVSAALELAAQIAAGALPAPEHIVLSVGSGCTSAGLLLGIQLAARLGLGFTGEPPMIHAVRVTPWPVTARERIAALAWSTSRRLEAVIGPVGRFDFRRLLAGIRIERRYLGGGYGRPTAAGRAAIAGMRALGGPPLDVVYSGKSAAALFDLARRGGGPIVFWATKSSAPLPVATAAQISGAPAAWRDWLELSSRP